MSFDLEIEPPSEPRLALEPEPVAEPVALSIRIPPPIMQTLGEQFPLVTLLQFLPDVRLKQKAEAAAFAAMAIDVMQSGGLEKADASLVPIRQAMKEIDECFKFPVETANALHKRLTGLRGDFKASGETALKTVGDRVYQENRRLERLKEDARLQAQLKADAEAKERAAAAARVAEQSNAAPQFVQALKRQAETATAPPVASPIAGPPKLANSTTTEKWKGRFKHTVPGGEPEPATEELTPEQNADFLALVRAVAQGSESLGLLEVNWPAVNARANAERAALDIPGLEAYDAGGLRGKARR